ncbi:MAG TPA: hypothetical protein VNS63_10865 [Blastocatellia bacterium]|nr:hypothetical protein [Blastocatellia bacterium]
MGRAARLTCGIVFCLSLTVPAAHRFQACLPDDVKATDIVSVQAARPGTAAGEAKRITVEQKLMALKARCKKGKLVDDSGKEIRFYRLVGCWGNPPADYQEILARQTEEIEKLKKQYTVIEMTCNPDGGQRH